jgi:uncharacterized protein affecting Mg2+/Co2+ transport
MTRSWTINKGSGHVEQIVNQDGVIGQHPVITRNAIPFIYESQCPTHAMGTKMKGHFVFRYIEGPKKD